MSPTYELVFDVSLAGYRQWTYPARVIALAAIGWAWLAWRRTQPPPVGKWRRAQPYLFVGFTTLMALVTLITTYWDYHHLSSRLKAGDYRVVEGTVTRFVPMPRAGHSMESFEVNGARYAYSDFVIEAGFNNAQSHGGPIREGLRVRIADVDGQIARLEVDR